MACYHLNKAIQYYPGSKPRFISKKSKDYESLLAEWQSINDSYPGTGYPKALKLPCQQCIGCRMTYARNWAIRCMLEASLRPDDTCYFVTLTYDDEHVVRGFACNSVTGEVTYETMTLCPDHVQKFLRDLRRYFEYHYNIHNIKFFASGEYGSLGKRPHYHM